MSTVLVTGGSGFIGSYCILQLLSAGHEVRATLRNLKREPEVRAMLGTRGAVSDRRLSFVSAELERDAGWREAVEGCEHVLHVASPLPPGVPKHDEELIMPAREGTLRVLRASRDAGVKRVVLTSSFAAIGYGRAALGTAFDETYWTDASGKVSAYVKSKTLAEQAAWKFVAEQGGGLELSTVNPVIVLGPVLGPDFSASVQLIVRMMNGAMPGCPQLYFGVVDVRDVADLHLRAMSQSAAKGERFLAVAGDFMSLLDMANVLRRRLGNAARRVPARQIPNWLVRIAAIGSAQARQILPELGKRKNASNEKARRVLGWSPRSSEECILAAAESLARYGVLKDSPV